MFRKFSEWAMAYAIKLGYIKEEEQEEYIYGLDPVSYTHLPVSVGSDTHYIAEYRKKQIRRANELLQKLNIPLP